MQTYNSIAKTVAKFEKEIKNYANELKSMYNYDNVMVEFTGYDFYRTAMTAEITIKCQLWGKYGYNYFKVIATNAYNGEVIIDCIESTIGKKLYSNGEIPEEHGFGAIMVKF